MQASQNDPQPLWTITNVVDAFGPGGLSVPTRVKQVYFKLVTGQESYVEIPLSQFNPDNVHAIVDEHAKAMLAALDLKGEMIG